MDLCPLLAFEEDHLLLVLGAVEPREPGVRARVCRTEGRFGVHSGLEDGVEQSVLIGDRLRPVLGPRLPVLRVERGGCALLQIVDPLLHHLAADSALAVADGKAVEPGRHVLFDQLLVLATGITLDAGEQPDLLHGEGLEHLIRAAQILDEPAPTYPARRPLLAMSVHQVPEALGGLRVLENF